jgi:outer membrane protein TolC
VAVSEQSLFFRTLELRRLFGMPSDPSLPVFAASEVPSATAREIEMVGEIQRALESNPQLRSVKMGLKLSEIDMQTAQATMRPQLDFVGAIGATGRKRVFSEAVAQTYGLDDLTWSAGLDLQIPIENRIARGQVRAAQLAGQRSRLDAGDFELTLRDQVMRLATMVRTAGKRVELTRATVGYAEKNLEAEKARFSVGRSTNNEVLLRQQELKNAEISVVRATVDLLNSEAALAALTGDLLDRYGIVLKGS